MVKETQPIPNLMSLGCVVKATFNGTKDESSTCGFILNPGEGIILTHGSILSEACLSNDTLLSRIKDGQHLRSADVGGDVFDVLVDKHWRPKNVPFSLKIVMETNVVKSNKIAENSFTLRKTRFLGAFRNIEFHNAIIQIMPQETWSFVNASQEDPVSVIPSCNEYKVDEKDDLSNSVAIHLLSYFILLQCEPLIYSMPQMHNNPSIFTQDISRNHEKCQIGAVAEIISTPFAAMNPTVFFNSCSRGVISNIAGNNKCWILTDARSIPGSEGGPLFFLSAENQRHLAGIVVASLCWKNKEWVGFSLACGIDSILLSLFSNIVQAMSTLECKALKVLDTPFHSTQLLQNEDMTIEKGPDRQLKFMPWVMLVKVGRVWGSGFVINASQGLILTCSHVIKDAAPPDPPIFIQTLNSSIIHKATVVYRQYNEKIEPFDLAVIRCPEAVHHLTSIYSPQVVSPVIGQRVWVCGHAVFDPELGLQPSVTSGVISKVVRSKDQDIMIESTCAVHAGASGGPLLDYNGDLVGIVVCNTVDKGSNSTYPHVNFSVPAVAVWPSIQHYIKTGDNSHMMSLKLNDPFVKKLWTLDRSIESEYTVKSKL